LKKMIKLACLAGLIGAVSLTAQQQAVASAPKVPTEMANAYLPRWIQLNGEARYREEGFFGNRFTEGNDDMYLLQRFRLGVRLQPAPWLGFYVQGQDSRAYATDKTLAAPPLQDQADLRQAWVQIGSSDHGAFDFRAGRQELAFGEERLVGASNWGNIGRSFDAIRLGIHHGQSRVDLFASSVVAARDHTFDHHIDGDDLHGAYGHVVNLIPKAELEPFFFWRLAPVVIGEAGRQGKLNARTFGVRLNGKLPHTLEYTTEMAVQSGSWSRDEIRAWAGFWRLGREFTTVKLRPKLKLELNRASGDSSSGDGRRGTFDVLYPTAHDKYGLADQVGWKNVIHVGLTGEARPARTLVIQAKGHEWWLDSATDGLYNSGGALLVRDATGTSGRHVGHEIDVQAIWTPDKHFSIGGGVGHLFPGAYLHNVSPGHSYTFPYVQITCGL
jgi:hypothetical protein